jgi:hypothetical protein
MKEDLSCVFLPLAFLENEQVKDLGDIGLIYEYREKAMPMGVNGMPVFSSFNILTVKEYERMLPIWKQMKEALV